MEEQIFTYIFVWVCIIGLCFGSFFNVVILRSLSNESIVFPPSKCPKCNNKLKPWHNIPVLSYIFLRGKCAFCKEKISIQYPLIEIITMLLFAISFWKFGISWQTLFTIITSSCLLIMTMTDLKEKQVDCNIAIGLGIIGFLYNVFLHQNWLGSILGILAGVVIFELLARIGYLLKKDRAFGEADTYVAGALGACVGIQNLGFILAYTLIVASIFTVPMFLYQQYKANRKDICILFILFAIAVLGYKLLFQNWITFAILATLGLLLSISILKNLKQESSPMSLPLVPAFFVATLYFLFF